MGIDFLTDGPIKEDIISFYFEKMNRRTDTGAHSIFLGQVRADKINGKKVIAIEYSAYEGMVKTEGDKIREAILSEFTDVRSVDIVHSTGVVKAGEISLFVLVSAGHRQQAIQACTRAVEMIKGALPVWKKEIFNDKSHFWKQNH
jgi:molybdopterin synthase catalytic subunit